ncbi:hypothetical protein [Nocardia tengchongensis]
MAPVVKHAGAVAAGVGLAVVAILAGTAETDPVTVAWDSSTAHYTRTISNRAPAVGETITITTTFNRALAGDERITWFEDRHPVCLTYVTDSATMTDAAGDHPVEPHLGIDPGFIEGDLTAAGDRAVMRQDGPAFSFSARYTVGSCAIGTALDTGMEYLSNFGYADFSRSGPSITVGPTPGEGGADAGAARNSLLGSLASLLGGFGSSS